MIEIPNTGHAPGTIILAAGHQPRHHEFMESLANVLVPTGSAVRIVRSCDVCGNFNKGIRSMIGEWAWFLGDDHEFDATTLLRLLDRAVDVVVPITPCKQPFTYPFVLHGLPDGSWRDDLQTYSWADLSGLGLKALGVNDFIGQAGMLVRTPVLERIGYPWFKCGKFDAGRLQEDMYFCRELQQLGYTVWIDQEIIFDHYAMAVVTAKKHEGKWIPAIRIEPFTIVLPDLA